MLWVPSHSISGTKGQVVTNAKGWHLWRLKEMKTWGITNESIVSSAGENQVNVLCHYTGVVLICELYMDAGLLLNPHIPLVYLLFGGKDLSSAQKKPGPLAEIPGLSLKA